MSDQISPGDAFAHFLDQRNRYAHDVFVSYSAKQEAAARRVAEALAEQGLSVFFAPVEMRRYVVEEMTGQYVSPLQNALARSCHCVALVSRSYLDSSWCLLELWGFFNLLTRGNRRTLRLHCLEDVAGEVPGRIRGLIHEGTEDELLDEIVAASAGLKCGEELGNSRRPPECFAPLPLREFYEPPPHAPRAPWKMDSRTPRGLPGGPPYDVYAALVREYMVHIMRGMEPENLSLGMRGLPDAYASVTRDARRDAQRLIARGESPFRSPRRPTLRMIWDDVHAARGQGDDSPGLSYKLGFVLLHRGEYLEAVPEYEKALAEKDEAPHNWVADLAQCHWGAGDPAKALETI